MIHYLDLFNLLTCIAISWYLFYKYSIPNWLAVVLTIQLTLPLFLNGFIFPVSYMPDQLGYFDHVVNLRENFFRFGNGFTPSSMEVTHASTLLSLVPIPFIETVNSVGLANRLIFVGFIVYLYKQKIFPTYVFMFLVLYPSLLLYSSLALRDFLVIALMVLAFFGIYRENYYQIIFSSVYLILFKVQNFGLIVCFYIFNQIFNNLKKIKLDDFIVINILLFLIFEFIFKHELENHREYFYWENLKCETCSHEYQNYQQITSYGALFWEYFRAIFYFQIMPLPSEWSKTVHIFQFVENILLIIFMSYAFFRIWLVDKLVAYKWVFNYLFALGLYGLVVFNFGTAARYRFVIPVVVVLAAYIELSQKKFNEK